MDTNGRTHQKEEKMSIIYRTPEKDNNVLVNFVVADSKQFETASKQDPSKFDPKQLISVTLMTNGTIFLTQRGGEGAHVEITNDGQVRRLHTGMPLNKVSMTIDDAYAKSEIDPESNHVIIIGHKGNPKEFLKISQAGQLEVWRGGQRVETIDYINKRPTHIPLQPIKPSKRTTAPPPPKKGDEPKNGIIGHERSDDRQR